MQTKQIGRAAETVRKFRTLPETIGELTRERCDFCNHQIRIEPTKIATAVRPIRCKPIANACQREEICTNARKVDDVRA